MMEVKNRLHSLKSALKIGVLILMQQFAQGLRLLCIYSWDLSMLARPKFYNFSDLIHICLEKIA